MVRACSSARESNTRGHREDFLALLTKYPSVTLVTSVMSCHYAHHLIFVPHSLSMTLSRDAGAIADVPTPAGKHIDVTVLELLSVLPCTTHTFSIISSSHL
jgi:hypothetical protein